VGGAELNPDSNHCAAIGSALAAIHSAGASFPQRRANDRGIGWWGPTIERLQGVVDEECQTLLWTELDYHHGSAYEGLPAGPVHADLFRDNALFREGELTAVIDFYSACDEALLFDLAICVNDWCIDGSGAIDLPRGRALVGAYCEGRPLTAAELVAWPDMLRVAAMRFLLSRLLDQKFPRAGGMTRVLDPAHFEKILRLRQQDPAAALALLPV